MVDSATRLAGVSCGLQELTHETNSNTTNSLATPEPVSAEVGEGGL